MKNTTPIKISGGIEDKLFRIIISPGIVLRAELSSSLRNTLKIMLRENLMHPFDTVQFAFKKSTPFEAEFSSQINQEFIIPPVLSVDRNCNNLASEENTSVELSFQLAIEGDIHDITISGTSSGLRKWENIALILGTFYYAGLVDSKYQQQVQEIVATVNSDYDDSSPVFSQYIGDVFAAIGGNSYLAI